MQLSGGIDISGVCATDWVGRPAKRSRKRAAVWRTTEAEKARSRPKESKRVLGTPREVGFPENGERAPRGAGIDESSEAMKT